MQSLLLQELQALTNLKFTPEDPEEKFIISGIKWDEYEHLLTVFEHNSYYRITYLDGQLQIMSPSRRHEVNKKNISRLLEIYFAEKHISFWALGSTTLRKKGQKVGKEPDECYCIHTEKDFPDLAIEIIYPSGSIDDLKVYQRLGIKEVWFWQNAEFAIYTLRDNQYIKIAQSELLPELDLDLLANYVNHPHPLEAMLSFQAAIRHH